MCMLACDGPRIWVPGTALFLDDLVQCQDFKWHLDPDDFPIYVPYACPNLQIGISSHYQWCQAKFLPASCPTKIWSLPYGFDKHKNGKWCLFPCFPPTPRPEVASPVGSSSHSHLHLLIMSWSLCLHPCPIVISFPPSRSEKANRVMPDPYLKFSIGFP